MVGCSFKNAILLSALAFSLIMSLPSSSAVALDPLNVEAAVQETHESIDAVYAILNGLPEQTRRDLNADIRLLTHSITRSVERLENQNPPIIDHAVVLDLHFLADIVHSISHELRALDPSTLTEVNEDMSRRLGELSTAASTRMDQIDNIVDQWENRKREFLIKFEEDDELVLVSYLNRLSLDTVRYIGISLLLIGILIVATLIKIEKTKRPIGEFFSHESHFSSKLLLTIFFLSCLLLATLPGTLVSLSADTEMLAQEDSCQSLQTQNDQLKLIQRINSAKLIELTKQRMEVTAADCLGVAEATAAVEQLAARAAASTRMAQSSLSEQEPTPIPTSDMARHAQIIPEIKVPEAKSASFLLDHLDLHLSENPDQTATANKPKPPEWPITTLSPPAVAAPSSKAKAPTPRKALQEVERSATPTEKPAQDKSNTQNNDIKPKLINQEPRISPAMATKAQESDGKVELYLHFRSRSDRDFVEELGNMLTEKGYEVSGIQLVEDAMTPGDIRYRHQDQEEEVENIRTIAEQYFNNDLSIDKIKLHPVYIGNIYPNLPRNRIELWIPQLKNT